jgi:hypothetical protein
MKETSTKAKKGIGQLFIEVVLGFIFIAFLLFTLFF